MGYLVLLIVGIAAFAVLLAYIGRTSRLRSLPAFVRGIRIEAETPRIIEDRIVEAVWSTPILLTNPGRRPAQAPILALRAEVVAGRRTFVAGLEFEQQYIFNGIAGEMNPGDIIVGHVTVILPGGETPTRVLIREARKGGQTYRHTVRKPTKPTPVDDSRHS